MLLDVRCLQGPSARRGIGTYARGLTRALSEIGFEYSVLVDGDLELPQLPPAVREIHRVRRRSHGRFAGYEDAVALRQDLDKIRPAIYHALTLSLPASSPCPVAVTVHDLIPWAFGGWRMLGERVRHQVARRLLPRAEMIFAVSNSTKADLLRIAHVAEDRVRVVYEGVDPEFRPRAGAEERIEHRWGLTGEYLLFVGALDVRKDPRGLVRAWQAAKAAGADLDLVVAGEPGGQAPADMGGARLLGHATSDELVDLLSGAACLLFPSLYEGFGLPALEALACGCPVVAYRNSSLPEVVGDAGLLVPNRDAEALGRAAAELVLDPARRRRLIDQGLAQAARFSWKGTADQTVKGYRDLLAIINAT
ncbi:MAG: glycosyltransferase family 4 protein [Candidatus Dormibacteraeota bacterium]|nr:glycosyltransferase family 4 protein [Candidatus Dormibacteraeota bacterium]